MTKIFKTPEVTTTGSEVKKKPIQVNFKYLLPQWHCCIWQVLVLDCLNPFLWTRLISREWWPDSGMRWRQSHHQSWRAWMCQCGGGRKTGKELFSVQLWFWLVNNFNTCMSSILKVELGDPYHVCIYYFSINLLMNC